MKIWVIDVFILVVLDVDVMPNLNKPFLMQAQFWMVKRNRTLKESQDGYGSINQTQSVFCLKNIVYVLYILLDKNIKRTWWILRQSYTVQNIVLFHH